MREIKFRSWDKESKEWLSGLEEYVIEPKDGTVYEVYLDEIAWVNYDVILEQYTGLKDMNGVEIYEGDIVKTFGSNTYVVEFFDGKFNPVSDLEASNWEVMGNIHENADLLEEL